MSKTQAGAREGLAAAKPYEPSDFELRMQAMHAAASAGEQAPLVAAALYAFLTDSPELPPRSAWPLPDRVLSETNAEYVKRVLFEGLGAASMAWSQTPRGVFDSSYAKSIGDALAQLVEVYADGEGPHVEIGGQRMTQAQYDAVRESIMGTPGEVQPPAHGLAVGDVLSAEQAVAAPVGTKFCDKDGDTTVRAEPSEHSDRPLSWPIFGRISPQKYAPYTVTGLPEPAEAPEPEDTTPRVGDTVRVREGATGTNGGHANCAGLTGTLGVNTQGDVYEIVGGKPGPISTMAHYGPVSDFELVERAK